MHCRKRTSMNSSNTNELKTIDERLSTAKKENKTALTQLSSVQTKNQETAINSTILKFVHFSALLRNYIFFQPSPFLFSRSVMNLSEKYYKAQEYTYWL